MAQGSVVSTLPQVAQVRMAAAAAFYGTQIVTDQPNSPHLIAPNIKGEVLLTFAEVDQYVQEGVPAKIKEVLDGAGDPHERAVGGVRGWVDLDAEALQGIPGRVTADRHAAGLGGRGHDGGGLEPDRAVQRPPGGAGRKGKAPVTIRIRSKTVSPTVPEGTSERKATGSVSAKANRDTNRSDAAIRMIR